MNLFSTVRDGKMAALVGVLAIAMSLTFAPAANAVPYSAAGVSVSGLGAQYGNYDYLTLAAYSGDGTGDVLLNPATFDVGYNAYSSATSTGTVAQFVTIDGVTQLVTIPYSIDIDYVDTLTLAGGNTYLFNGWKLTLLGLVMGPDGLGAHAYSYLANISPVPLPASLPLFAAGLAGLGLLARLRSKKPKTGTGAALA